jgi:hypothetical protein
MIQLTNCVERFRKVILEELKSNNIKCWIAGGSVRDYFTSGAKISDYDIFFPNEEEFNKTKKFFTEKNCEIKWESENGMKVVYNKKTFDLVKKFFDSPQKTIEEFDFTVSMFAVDYDNVYYGESSFIDLSKKQLMINKITYPASTLSRAFRYNKKGFNICLGEMKKLIESIQDMPKPEITDENQDEEVTSGDLGGFFLGID